MVARVRRLFSIEALGYLVLLAAIGGPILLGARIVLFAPAPIPATGAVLSTVVSDVQVRGIDTPEFMRAREEQVLVPGEDVRTSRTGRGAITFFDHSTVILDPDSEVKILPPVREGGGLVNRLRQSFGTSWAQFTAVASGGGRYEIETPNGIVAVRDGASLRVGIGRTATGETVVQVIVTEGSAEFIADARSQAAGGPASVAIGAGKMLLVEEGAALPAPVDAVLEEQITLTLASPFWLLVTEPRTGLATGVVPPQPGTVVKQIPFSSTTSGPVSPQTVRLQQLTSGTYVIHLLPKGPAGAFSLHAFGNSSGLTVLDETVAGEALACDWLYLLLHVLVAPDGTLLAAELEGPYFSTVLPVVFGQSSILGSCPPPSPLRAQIAGVQATAEPTPEPTPVPPTPVPPTPVPPTPVPPTPVPPTPVPPTPVPPTPVPTQPPVPEPTFDLPPPPPPPAPSPVIIIEPAGASLGPTPFLPTAALLVGIAPGGLLAVLRLLSRWRR